jgi:hypothetical protein
MTAYATGLNLMDNFEEFAQSMEPHPTKAQIMIALENSVDTVNTALALLENEGGKLEYKVHQKSQGIWLHVFISSLEMQDAVLKLSEAGFIRVRGLSAQNDSLNKC